MTASKPTPGQGESVDGSVDFDQYVAPVVRGELERVADNLKSQFFVVSRNCTRDDRMPTADEIDYMEQRVAEAQHCLQLLKTLETSESEGN